ncbi:hypothetical protein LWI28_024903 [Acer negundo]|uniref:CCHC-type domain-containing protein n=1 Tax=Acer negundo TaxID=4023 RepID=A0AAD5NKE3_ACENE|nr:hypothetical protein LWI28_024903 [Acer negundo]
MYTRFTDIINTLHSLGKSYANEDLVRKILRCLTKSWEAKVTVIEEAKDLTKLQLEELIGSLMTHGMKMLDNEDEEKKKRRITFKSSIHKRVDEVANMCFMAIGDGVTFNSKAIDFDYKSSYVELHDIFEELLVEFQKLVSKNKVLKNKISTFSNKNEILKNEKNELQKENDLLKQEKVSLQIDKNVLSLGNDPLKEENISLQKEDYVLKDMGDALQKENDIWKEKSNVSNEREALKFENENLLKENEAHKKKAKYLNDIVIKFAIGQKFLEKLLCSQKCVFNKSGLGYNSSLKQKFYKKYFIKASTNESHVTCNYCNRLGHKSYACPIRLNTYIGMKKIWVPKATKTNIQGPKMVWVPKDKT